jgi:MFS family permease
VHRVVPDEQFDAAVDELLGRATRESGPPPAPGAGARMSATRTRSSPLHTEADRERLQRRSLRILLASQVLSGAGLAAGVTVGALLAEDMLGTTGLSGLPAALLTLGSAAAAFAVGSLSDRRGRRSGLAAGYAAGAVGGAGVALAAVLDSVPLLLVALLVYGAGTATNLQARYAGADLALPERRGTAISTILVGTTLGAVAGPNVAEPVGRLADSYGIPPLAGPFVLASLAYALGAAVLLVWLRPDPLLVARGLAAQQDAADAEQRRASGAPAPIAQAVDHAALRLGGTSMVVTQLVMVAVMTMTPVHMRDHGHGLGATGLVIGLHIAAMFLPSPVTGRLADRYGPRPIAAAGGVALFGAGLTAATGPDDSVPLLAIALILLGLGWNLGLLAGTTLVAAAVPIDGRARVQGRLDVAVALAGATGGLASGFVMAGTSYGTLASVSGVLALAVLAAAVRPARTPSATPPTRS